MLSVTVRRSTLTIRSMTGISRKRPGPFGSGSSRPSRKMTPRSYSRATLTAAKRNRTTTTSTATRTIRPAVTFISSCSSRFGVTPWILRRAAGLPRPVRREHASPGTSGSPSTGARAPELAVDGTMPSRARHRRRRRPAPATPDRCGPAALADAPSKRERPEAARARSGDADRAPAARPGTRRRPGRRAAASRATKHDSRRRP